MTTLNNKQAIEIIQDEKKVHEQIIRDIEYQFDNTYWDADDEDDRRKYAELEEILEGHKIILKALDLAIESLRTFNSPQCDYIAPPTSEDLRAEDKE